MRGIFALNYMRMILNHTYNFIICCKLHVLPNTSAAEFI